MTVGFVRNVLDNTEEVLAELRPHVAYVLPPLLVVALALAIALAVAVQFPGAPMAVGWVLGAMVLIPVLWVFGRLLRWRAIRFLVTDTRLVYRRGVFGRDVVQLRLQRVAEVHCTQSILGRLIGCGRLVFEVAAGEGPLVVDDVPRPRSVQRLITRALDDMDAARRPAWGAPPTPVPSAAPVRRAPAPRTPDRTWTDTPPRGLLPPGSGGSGGLTASSVPGRLVQLDELRRRGIISEAEFAAKKAELLQRL